MVTLQQKIALGEKHMPFIKELYQKISSTILNEVEKNGATVILADIFATIASMMSIAAIRTEAYALDIPELQAFTRYVEILEQGMQEANKLVKEAKK